MEETNTTIDYYNNNADRYFRNTVNANMSGCCDRFLKYVVPGGIIIDIGAGSGRDIKYFLDRGYVVDGIDASEEMCRLASTYSGIKVNCEKIQDWHPDMKYDGIWANASLLHLKYAEIEEFICRTSNYLRPNGVLYVSVKKGIQTGNDADGRFYTGFSNNMAEQLSMSNKEFEVVELWETADIMGRSETTWINIILKKR